MSKMKLTKKIELTFEENELLQSALYYAILHSKDVLDLFNDIDSSVCKYHLKLLKGYESLHNRLYGFIPNTTKGGAADEK